MQCVDTLRLELPADHGLLRAGIAADPGMHQQSRWIDFEIFPFHIKCLAVGADSIATPLAPGPKIHGGRGNTVETFLSPPARELGWITDRLKNARGRRGDEDLG